MTEMKQLMIGTVLCLSVLSESGRAVQLGWPTPRQGKGTISLADFQQTGHLRRVNTTANVVPVIATIHGGTSSMAMEERLQTLEDKVTRLEEKVDPKQPGHASEPGQPDRGLEMSNEKAKKHWGYVHPEDWKSEFPVCGEGKKQSPVNIDLSHVEKVGEGTKLEQKIHYKALEGLNLKNNGHNCQVDAEDLGFVAMPDGEYKVHQFHFHFPSEHEVDGKLAAGEMHIVHQKDGEKAGSLENLLVIGIMFDEGPENLFLKQLGFTAPMPADEANVKIEGKVDVEAAFAKELQGDFFRYDGSLTTPPCAETVKWFVMKDRATASKAQIEVFKALYPNPSNNRPVQAMHERHVVLDSLHSKAPRLLALGSAVPLVLLAGVLSFF